MLFRSGRLDVYRQICFFTLVLYSAGLNEWIRMLYWNFQAPHCLLLFVKTGHSSTKLAELDTELDELISVVVGQDDHEPSLAKKLPPNEKNQVRLRTEDLVDFGPVYRCLHIHSVLNERAEFERHYCAQRRKQCQLSLSLTPNQQVSDIRSDLIAAFFSVTWTKLIGVNIVEFQVWTLSSFLHRSRRYKNSNVTLTTRKITNNHHNWCTAVYLLCYIVIKCHSLSWITWSWLGTCLSLGESWTSMNEESRVWNSLALLGRWWDSQRDYTVTAWVLSQNVL